MKRYVQLFVPRSLRAPPEILLTLAVGAILATLIIPLPSGLLDLLLATNLALAGLILICVLLSRRPLALSSFPTVLLLTTLFRLGLNVSTTRMILSEGSAGEVVAAFGQFVARGDVPMGLVVFLVLTLVQLLVIAKGAERVAEVGARFTLDAMPGKQMSIDAAQRAGTLTEEEAEARRRDLGRESQFYGAMDGAMKFVKGDATVGLIVTVVNLVAGFAIGALRFGMSMSEAAETFAILTIGDGLVSQIPTLLIALSAGVLTTRVGPETARDDLAQTLRDELFGSDKALALAGVFTLILGLVPGLPGVPFFALTLVLFGIAAALRRHGQPGPSRGAAPGAPPTGAAFDQELERRRQVAAAQQARSDQLAPTVSVLRLQLGVALSEALGFSPDGGDQGGFTSSWLPDLRNCVFADHGVQLPAFSIGTYASRVPPDVIQLLLHEVPVAAERVEVGMAFCATPADQLRRVGIPAEPSRHPLTGGEAALIPLEQMDRAIGLGAQAFDVQGRVALIILSALQNNLHELIGLEEAAIMVNKLEEVCPHLVRETIPRLVTLTQVRDVLQTLLREGVSVRNLKGILEAMAAGADQTGDTLHLTEHVRAALGRQIVHQLSGTADRLAVLTLDPWVEDSLRDAIITTQRGTYLAMDTEVRDQLLEAITRASRPLLRAGLASAILTHEDIRPHLFNLIAEAMHPLPVVSYRELPASVVIQPQGCIGLETAHLAA